MSASPTRPAESGTGAVLERGLDTSNGLDFVRERLALVGKTLFLVSFGFYLFLLASMVLVGGAPFVAVVMGPVALGHLAASGTMGLLWLLARRGRLSVRSLGTLDAVSVSDLRGELDALVNARPKAVDVDLSQLRMIDSSGVGALVSLYKRVREKGGTVAIRGVRDQPLAIFQLLQLDRFMLRAEKKTPPSRASR